MSAAAGTCEAHADACAHLREHGYVIVQLAEREDVEAVQRAVDRAACFLSQDRHRYCTVDGRADEEEHRRLIAGGPPVQETIIAHFPVRSQMRLERTGVPAMQDMMTAAFSGQTGSSDRRMLARLGRWICSWCDASLMFPGRRGQPQTASCTEVGSSTPEELELLGSMDDVWQILERVATSLLPARLGPILPSAGDGRQATESIFDAFFYPDDAMGSCKGLPCAAHEDPGIITVIADNALGLQFKDSQGSWLPIVLERGQVVAVAGRAWANFDRFTLIGTDAEMAAKSCVHRVQRQPSLTRGGSRCSVAFEIRSSMAGQKEIARAQAAFFNRSQ